MALQDITDLEAALLGLRKPTRYVSNNLDNEILPVLQYEYEGRTLWNIEPLEYECLKPTLRLASALAASPMSVQLLYDISCAPRVDGRSELSSLHHSPDLMNAYVHQVWRNMAQNIRFAVSSTKLEEECGGETHCYYVSPNKGLKRTDPGWNGCYNTIYINQKMVGKLLFLMKRLPLDHIRVLYAALELAALLCHELTHATNQAVSSCSEVSCEYEPYYLDYASNELGFTWEQQVLGGSLSPSEPDRSKPLPQHLMTYPGVNPGWEDRGEGIPRYPSPPNMVEWFLHLPHVARLQQQSFWDNLSGNLEACRFPKLIGEVVESTDPEAYQPEERTHINLGDAEGDYTVSEEGGDGVDTPGRIVHKRALDPQGTLAERWTTPFKELDEKLCLNFDLKFKLGL